MSMTIGNMVAVKGFQFGALKTWAATAAATTAEQTVTVPGLRLGDIIVVNKPTAQAGLGGYTARVSAVDTLALTIVNATAGSLTCTANEVWLGSVSRPDFVDGSAAI